MGSGGPRGLQILLSVADRGRGGFDSHTFPPQLLLLLLLFLPATARAQAGDVPARADTVLGERLRPWHERPAAIMARSALLPGWGQLENGRPLKAGLALALEGVAGVRLVRAWGDVNDATRRENRALALGDPAGADLARADYERAFNRRATAGWMFGIALALSMVDAYVDAHLIQFDADFGPDPALPEDTSVGALPGTPGPRLSLRWSF